MQEAIKKLLKMKIKSRNDLMMAKRKIAREFACGLIDNSEILKYYNQALKKGKIKEISGFPMLLRKRAIRTMSGIAPVAVLTKPYDCPGTCAYCPRENDVPTSYLSNEPAVMRAIRCAYNPYVQVQDRLRALIANGHEPTKIELIVIGGTWSVLPRKYKLWYVTNLFAAANQFSIKNYELRIKEKYKYSMSIKKLEEALISEQKKNEKAKYKIIGLTLETRPDYIDEKELEEMRELGCTRVEIGVQAIDDKILKKNKRGHGVDRIVEATRLLKEYGFKITYHLMPGLPGATVKRDKEMYDQLFSDARFQPDQIKFYPTVVTKGSEMYKWWQQGNFKPYTTKKLEDLIVHCKTNTPEYVRIIRLIRDIPGESIEAGNKVTNLRQVMQQRGVKCSCIRCREVKNEKIDIKNQILDIIRYQASGGEEFFIQIINKERKLLGFCRLRLASDKKTAYVRELHVYGELASIGGKKKTQHTGIGRKLMEKTEKLAKNNNCSKIKVISGVGVRGYYRRLGYRLKNTYMEKKL